MLLWVLLRYLWPVGKGVELQAGTRIGGRQAEAGMREDDGSCSGAGALLLLLLLLLLRLQLQSWNAILAEIGLEHLLHVLAERVVVGIEHALEPTVH